MDDGEAVLLLSFFFFFWSRSRSFEVDEKKKFIHRFSSPSILPLPLQLTSASCSNAPTAQRRSWPRQKGWIEEHWRPRKCLEASERRSGAAETIVFFFSSRVFLCAADDVEGETRCSSVSAFIFFSLSFALSLPSVLYKKTKKQNSGATTMLDVIRRLAVAPPGAKAGSGPETILGSALACSLFFGLLQSTGIALPKAPKLKRADVLQWNMRVVSTVHASILTVGEHRYI